MARSARYDDPVFAPWQNHCPSLPMNAVLCPRLNYLTPESEEDDLRLGFSTGDFRLSEVDFDGHPATPPTLVFFGEAAYDWRQALDRFGLPRSLPSPDVNWNAVLPPASVPRRLATGRGGFAAVDLAVCTVELAEIAHNRPLERDISGGIDDFYNRRLSGILTYRGRTVFYALSWVGRPPRPLELVGLRAPASGGPSLARHPDLRRPKRRLTASGTASPALHNAPCRPPAVRPASERGRPFPAASPQCRPEAARMA
jgi:hypothetical protein